MNEVIFKIESESIELLLSKIEKHIKKDSFSNLINLTYNFSKNEN